MSLFGNPFAALSGTVPVAVMQIYVIAMAVLVVAGTLLDVWHKRSAEYFFANAKKAKDAAVRELSPEERRSALFKTVAEDVLTSAEFCNPDRRKAHLLTMYGFVIFLLTTIIMVFSNAPAGPSWVSVLWHVGAAMVLIGGFWFWFFIRADVAAEGNPWYRIVRADLFILSLLATTGFGLLWAVSLGLGMTALSTLYLALFIPASAVLFGGVLWSKFAHMFFKPAAAYQKRIAEADGSLDNLPKPADRRDPADSDRHSMELLKDAPLDMGLGIKREQPHHY